MIDTETARQIAVETLRELGGDDEPTTESWLVRKGYVVGQRIICGGLSAVWFFEAAEVKVYDGEGKVVKVVSLTEAKKAA